MCSPANTSYTRAAPILALSLWLANASLSNADWPTYRYDNRRS